MVDGYTSVARGLARAMGVPDSPQGPDYFAERPPSVPVHQPRCSPLPLCRDQLPYLSQRDPQHLRRLLPRQSPSFHLHQHSDPLLLFHCQCHSFVHRVTFSLNSLLVTDSLNSNTPACIPRQPLDNNGCCSMVHRGGTGVVTRRTDCSRARLTASARRLRIARGIGAWISHQARPDATLAILSEERELRATP